MRESEGMLIWAVFSAALVLSGGETTAAPEDAGTAIRRLEDELIVAFNKYDAAAIDRLWGDDLTFVYPNGTLANKEQRLAGLKDIPPSIPTSINESVDVRTFGEVTVAIVVSKWSGVSEGKPFAARYRATHVWARRTGVWKLVAVHVSQIEE